MDLRFAGRPVPPLAALDAVGLVVHLFSFSKSLFPGRARRVDRGAGSRGRGARRAQAGDGPLGRACRSRPRSPSSSTSGAYDRHLVAISARAARPPRRAARGARASRCPRARAGRGPRAATRCGSSCPAGSTRATCWRTPSARACSSRPAPSSCRRRAPRAACGSRSRMADEDALRRGVAALGARARRPPPRGPRSRRRGARTRVTSRGSGRHVRGTRRRRRTMSERATEGNGGGRTTRRRVLRAQGRPRRDAEGRRDHGRDGRRSRRRSPRTPAPRR